MKRLCWLYAVLPASVLVVALDVLVLGGQLRSAFPRSPQGYLFFALLFGTPHIVASNLILFGTPEYLRFYWKRLLWISAAILAFFATFGLLLPRPILVALIAAWTVSHVVKQQIGIGNISSRLSGPLYTAWTRTGIAVGVTYYIGIFVAGDWTPSQQSSLRLLLVVGAAATAAMTLALVKQVRTPLGLLWLCANGATMTLGAIMFLAGYPLLAILMPRVVHDGTAFAFYLAHDANRLRSGVSGFLYRPFRGLGFASVIVLPVVAIALSALMERGADAWFNRASEALFGFTIEDPFSLGVVGFLALLHYSFESFTWKGDSPYRSYVLIK